MALAVLSKVRFVVTVSCTMVVVVDGRSEVRVVAGVIVVYIVVVEAWPLSAEIKLEACTVTIGVMVLTTVTEAVPPLQMVEAD